MQVQTYLGVLGIADVRCAGSCIHASSQSIQTDFGGSALYLNGGQKAALTKRPALQYGGGVGQRRIFAWLRRTAVAGVAAGGPVGGSLDVRFAPLRLLQFLSPLRVRRDQQFRNASLSVHRVGHRKLHFLF
jgi:hypothetical protein